MIDPGAIPGQTASLDFGEKTQMQRERQAIASAGSPGQGQPPPGAQPQPQPGAATQSSGPPVQPSPRQPLRPEDLAPGGPVFSQPKLQPAQPWRQELRNWASHPAAGPFLASLRMRADAELKQHPPQQAQQGQQPQP